MKDKIEMFEEFVALGFTNSTRNRYSISTGVGKSSGYDMKPIVKKIDETCNMIIDEAYKYDKDENPDHTLESYINEAKKCFNDKIEEACNKK